MSISEGLEPANLEIDEVTIDASLLTGTSPTTQRIARDNPKINLEKCKYVNTNTHAKSKT
jgi:hypothetical protein